MIKGRTFPFPAAKDGGKIKIACIGDSITEGWRSSNPALRSYPAVLQTLIGDGYEITNYGIGGSTVMRCSDMPYRDKWGYINSISDAPDVVFLMMGTNDCNRDYNIERLGGFYADFASMINEYRQVGAYVAVMTSPELFCNRNNANIRRAVEWQKKAAENFGCPVIDINEFSHTRHHFFPDDIHCDDSGYIGMAHHVANRAFGLDLYEVTVTTNPFAKVTVGGVRVPADKNGVAKFELPAGEYCAYSFLAGCKSGRMNVHITADCNVDIPLASGGTDLAYKKPATCSSHEPGNTPDRVTDGNEETRWASLARDGEWITVDLGDVYTVTGVALTWEMAFGEAFDIQLSTDGENFVTAASERNGSGGENELELPENSRARYVRMYGIRRGTFYGFSLYDFKVYGK